MDGVTPIYIPEWLPSAEHAVLRWEWYALHLYPNIEFFTQCVDVKIQGCDGGPEPSSTFAIPGHISNDGQQYRDPWNPSAIKGVTGPSMVTPNGNVPSSCPKGDDVNSKYEYKAEVR